MAPLLYIPWFKLEEFHLPAIPGLSELPIKTWHAVLAVVILMFISGDWATRSEEPWKKIAYPIVVLGALVVGLGYIHKVPIQPFGILVATGVFLGLRWAEYRGKQLGFAPSIVADFAAHVVFIGFIMGYFLNALFYEPDTLLEVLESPSKITEKYLGLSSFGGFIGSLVGLAIWKARRKLPALPVADVIVYCFPLGWLFGRLGCFSVHDHPGDVTTFFLGVQDYRVGEPPYLVRHDLGLYEVIWSIGCIAIFLVLGRKPKPPGYFLAMFGLLYAPIRFGLDFLRAGTAEGGDVRYFGLTPGHYNSIAMFVGASILMYWAYKRPPTHLPAEMLLKDETAKS